MSVLTRQRPQVQPGNDNFGHLLLAEWTKLRTVRGWVVGLVVGALAIIGLAALTGANSHCSMSLGPSQNLACPAPPTGPGGEWVSDAFYFVRQPLAGNGTITTRVTSLTGQFATHPSGAGAAGGNPLAGMTHGVQPWSKAGLIIKASTKRGSAYAAMMVTGKHGVRMQWNFTHDVAGLSGKVSAASPRWLRLVRSGNVIRGYDSADGTHWTLVGTARLAGLPATAQAGLFAATPGYTSISTSLGSASATGGPAVATATFDRVNTRGAWPAGRWTGQDIQGITDNAVSASAQGFSRSGGRFTVTGSGDIAPAENSGPGSSDPLAGAFAGLIAMVVIGVMFITAEYRRGMIRTTFAASPRRGRVLAAKAVVLGVVVFLVSLAAVAIAVPLGDHLLHANGNPIFQLPALTLFRVEAGTAGLMALSAVLALAVGTLVRRSAIAVTAVIAGVVLPYLLAVLTGVLPLGVEEWLVRVTPAAAFAIQQTSPAYRQVLASYTPGTGYYPLAPWAGFAVLCAWTAVALALAAYVLRRRDA